MIFFKIRHRWGILLGQFVKRFPKITSSLRGLGLPVNGYLPRLPRTIRELSLNGGFLLEQPLQGHPHPSLQDLIDEQKAPTLDFKGNVRPIRISRLRKDLSLPLEPGQRKGISPIWPGDPYEFESEYKYLEHYAGHAFAFSPRKGGWDTMRSVELCSVGTFPLIPGLERSGESVLYGYPKELLSRLWEMARDGWLPSSTPDQHAWLRDWAQRHLTSSAQATFLLSQLQYFDSMPGEVLYLDFNLAMTPDYVSMGNLVGLHRVLGHKLKTFRWPAYLTSNSLESSSNLYGRGFGYSGELFGETQSSMPPILNYPTEGEGLIEYARLAVAPGNITHIVIGGLEYADEFPKMRLQVIRAIEELGLPVALVYGGDFTLSRKSLAELSQSSLLFVREFERADQFSH